MAGRDTRPTALKIDRKSGNLLSASIFYFLFSISSSSLDSSGGLARGAADSDPPRHADFLDVGGAARMHQHDAVALLAVEEAVVRAPGGIGGQRLWPYRL